MTTFDPTSSKIMYEEMLAHIAQILFVSSWAILDRSGIEDELNPNKRMLSEEEVETVLTDVIYGLGIKGTVNVINQRLQTKWYFTYRNVKNVLFPVMVIPENIDSATDVLKLSVKILYYLRFNKYNTLNTGELSGDVVIDFSPVEDRIADLYLYYKAFTNENPSTLQDPIVLQILSTFETLYRNRKNIMSLTVIGGLELLSQLVDKDYKDRGIKIDRVK